MRLVRTPQPTGLTRRFEKTPLSVVFADGADIDAVGARRAGSIPLAPPFHVSDDDCYLVLPDEVGLELVSIMQDGDLELLHAALRDGLLVVGAVGRTPQGMSLLVEEVARPADVLTAIPYAATVEVGASADAVSAVNALPHVRCTVLSRLVDDDGLERMLERSEHVGTSWRVPGGAAAGVDPTYAWSRRAGAGRIGIELALFLEYEELVVLLRPVELVAA